VAGDVERAGELIWGQPREYPSPFCELIARPSASTPGWVPPLPAFARLPLVCLARPFHQPSPILFVPRLEYRRSRFVLVTSSSSSSSSSSSWSPRWSSSSSSPSTSRKLPVFGEREHVGEKFAGYRERAPSQSRYQFISRERGLSTRTFSPRPHASSREKTYGWAGNERETRARARASEHTRDCFNFLPSAFCYAHSRRYRRNFTT